MKRVLAICPYCGTGCNIYFQVQDGKVKGVYPSYNNNINQGKLCVKGYSCAEIINHPDRLRCPLIKKGNKLVMSSWNDAISKVAQKFSEIIKTDGSDAVGIIGSARTTNEELYQTQKFARAVIGTNNVDHCARICHSPTVVGLIKSLGSGGMTNPISDIENAKTILLIGSNPYEAHPIIAWRIINAVDKGTDLIVVDPRKTPLVKFCKKHLQIKPGSDIKLINALCKIIIEEKLDDKDFIEKNCERFNEFNNKLKKFSLKEAAEITGIEKDTLRDTAIAYASNRPSSIIYALGITEHITGTSNVRALANLAMLTGNLGKEGTGINPLRGQNNVQGGCDMGVAPYILPGYIAISSSCEKETEKNLIEKYEKQYKNKIPKTKGLMIPEMIKAALEGDLKAMWVIGEDILISEANRNKTKEALKNLDFLVVSDIFLSETAKKADVIFPACSFAEKEGTFTNTERRVQKSNKAIEPLFESKSDLEIISLVAREMGYDIGFDPKEVFEEISYLTLQYRGISYEKIKKQGGVQWPCRSEEDEGTPILHKNSIARGRGEFFYPKFLPPDETPDENYPFYLSTGRILFHFNSATMTKRVYRINREFEENFVMLNPIDAEKYGIKNGEPITVENIRGALLVKASVTDDVQEGLLWMPFHFAKKPTNQLTNDALDPQSGVYELKVCAARIKKCQ